MQGLRRVLLWLCLAIAAPAASHASDAHHHHGDLDPEAASLQEDLLAIAQAQSPDAALAELRRRMAESDVVAGNCHPLVHALGQQALDQTSSVTQALSFTDFICNGGFMHGVIESYLPNATDLAVAIEETCEPFEGDAYATWQCYHGIGHGVMASTGDDADQALSYCKALEDENAVGACANGVFMELFRKVPEALAPGAESELFATCNAFKRQWRTTCYVYLPTAYLRFRASAFVGALELCGDSPRKYRRLCAAGVGSELMKQNISNPGIAEDICMTTEADPQEACLSGSIVQYLLHHGTANAAASVCAAMSRETRSICEDTAQAAVERFFDG